MTREEKELLLRDLCGRLPYRVYVQVVDRVGYTHTRELTPEDIQKMWSYKSIKPYLRPMSSMTEEEEQHVEKYFTYTGYNDWDYVDWLLKHHFDFRGLIDKGLALSTDEYNPYVED